MLKLVVPFLIGVLAVLPADSQEESDIRFKGAQAFYEFGNIVKGIELVADTLDNMWVQRFGGTFDVQASRGEYLDLYLGAGSVFWHAIPAVDNKPESQIFLGDAILTKAYAQFTFGNKEDPGLRGKLGFFPVKYSHSKNLGEYLFRTGTYPAFIITGNGYTVVNTSDAKLLGTQWSHRLGSGFSHDLFFTSERQSYPMHDFSLTYLVKYKDDFLSAGFGVQFNRLIPVRPSITTPGNNDITPGDEDNQVFMYQGRWLANNPGLYEDYAIGADSAGDTIAAEKWWAEKDLIDSLQIHWDTVPSSIPPMEKISFKGIKPLAMVSFDFKALLGEEYFHNDEMVLYSEAVLMGWKNQPIYYEDRMDRLAVMAGLNLPTFGFLDYLNVEVEYWPFKYINGYRNAREARLPLPDYNYDYRNGYYPNNWSSDDLKWSVFLERKLLDGFHVQAQVASDHLRGRRYTRVVSENSLLYDSNHWYYFIKLQASL